MVACRLTEHGKDCTVACSLVGEIRLLSLGVASPGCFRWHVLVWFGDTGDDRGIPVMIHCMVRFIFITLNRGQYGRLSADNMAGNMGDYPRGADPGGKSPHTPTRVIWVTNRGQLGGQLGGQHGGQLCRLIRGQLCGQLGGQHGGLSCERQKMNHWGPAPHPTHQQFPGGKSPHTPTIPWGKSPHTPTIAPRFARSGGVGGFFPPGLAPHS